jgi:predicted RNA binding protein YcfA (HicA-like mRNA interferase family)
LDPSVRYYRYREVVAQLKRLTGSELIRSNGSHHIFRTALGRTFPVPRHPGDIGRGLLKTIIKQAGLQMTEMEFMQA